MSNPSPAADLAAPLLAMDGQAYLLSVAGEGTVPVHGLFLRPHRTA